jgi:hypothetical protein
LQAFAYWLSNLAFDVIFFIVPWLGAGLVTLATGTDGLAAPGINLCAIMLLLFSFGPAMLTFTYLYSFIFDKAMNAQTFILGMIVIFAIYMGVASVAGVPGWVVHLVECIGYCLNLSLSVSLSLFLFTSFFFFLSLSLSFSLFLSRSNFPSSCRS